MNTSRHSGILLHPSSLPGPFGSGDIGESAYHFVDWLVVGGQSLWQVLPLGGVGPGNSPYMSPSAFAGNELLIDLVQLKDAGWLHPDDLIPPAGAHETRVDFAFIRDFRFARLRRAAAAFFAPISSASQEHKAYDAFCASARDWLDDYALFMALDNHHGQNGTLWQDWPEPLARREPRALREARREFADQANFWKFCQWRFFSQWASLKQYANSRGVELIGDVPIFVSPHSADVWAHQALFDLKADGHPRVIAGVPPDYFSQTGQRWGNPLYRWEAHAQTNYQWWVERMRAMQAMYDIVRIDHFRGFAAYWEIPAECETAIGGSWKQGPGKALFDALHAQLAARLKTARAPLRIIAEDLGMIDAECETAIGGSWKQGPGKALFDALHAQLAARRKTARAPLRIIAEDLGMIDAEVTTLRDAIGLPGMRILQFAFDGDPANWYLPHNYCENTVAYTGTHDNDTTCGWWHSLDAQQQDHVRRYLGTQGDTINWDMMRALSGSVANTVIFPMQDVLGLDSAHRMNQPGVATGSWEWRFSWHQVAHWHAERLAELARLYGRVKTAATAAPHH